MRSASAFRRPRSHRVVLAAGWLLAAMTAGATADRAAAAAAELMLPYAGEVTSATPHTHRLALAAGELLTLELRRVEADVSLVVRDSAGGELVADTLVFPPGARPVLLLAAEARTVELEVRLLPGAERSRYSLAAVARRPAEPGDEQRLAAQAAYLDGERLRSRGTGESLGAALPRLEEALLLARALGDRAGEADALTAIARVREARNEKPAALAAYEEALALHRTLGRDAAAAYVLGYAALVHEQLGDRQRSLALLTEGLALARAGGDRRVEGLSLNNLGMVLMNLGQLDEAQPRFAEAMVAHRAAGNPRAEATTLANLALLYQNRGDVPRALETFSRVLQLRYAIGDLRDLAGTLNNIGALHFQTDSLAEATAHYEQALAVWRAAGERSGEAATLHNLARVHEAAGEYRQAIGMHLQALAIFRATQSRVREANALTTIGRLYASLGDHRRALATLGEALPIHREVGSRNYEATTLTEMANVRTQLGEAAAAVELHEQALALRRATADPLGEASALRGYARARLALGEAAAARELLVQARERYVQVGQRRGEAAVLVNLAQASAALGDGGEARRLAGEAVARAGELGDRRGEAGARLVLARLAAEGGDLEGALAELEPALAAFESLRSRVAVEELRSTFLASVEEAHQLAVDLLVRLHRRRPADGFAARALAASEASRARALLDALAEARAGIREGVEPALLERERALRRTLDAKAARQAALGAVPDAAERALALGREIEALTAELQGVEAEIRGASPRYAALLAPRPLDADAIQREVLDEGTLLLEVALGVERSYLFAATRDSLAVHDLPARAGLEEVARRFVAASRQRGESAERVAAGEELARLVLGPLQGRLERRVVIVPAGALQLVPWAALPVPGTSGRPLLADHELVVLPSASTLGALRRDPPRRPAPDRDLVVLADPVFTRDDPRVRAAQRSAAPAAVEGVDRGSFARLLGSRREATAILDLVPPARRRLALDFAASRGTATDRELGRYRIVHFATHGVLDDVFPELSGIVLSLVDERGEEQDGFLRLHEIGNLELAPELVVLSACQTALGKEVAGEGLLGFNRAFMYAGAPRVVSTLWRVDDRATAELMRRFYAAMLGAPRQAPAAALRAAQLSLAAEPRWQSPYYWAGFVLQGEWR